jgi:NAD(P)-dependent dehydrogenase (short-subunit alcohol dehydrogenase family)
MAQEGADIIAVDIYTSAKHGLTGLMKTFALELAPHRIRSIPSTREWSTPTYRN